MIAAIEFESIIGEVLAVIAASGIIAAVAQLSRISRQIAVLVQTVNDHARRLERIEEHRRDAVPPERPRSVP